TSIRAVASLPGVITGDRPPTRARPQGRRKAVLRALADAVSLDYRRFRHTCKNGKRVDLEAGR
ncbi:MAG TPA: hypothetical protein VGM60_03140, partial [Pseudonocardia sp.]|uniref:hypothetical protein n=1 Tax=Pseudonocardia sp. TaxID=60912 RepID=UPI002F4042DE